MSGSLNHSLKAIDLKALIHSGTKHHNCVAQKGCCCFVWKKTLNCWNITLLVIWMKYYQSLSK